MGGKKSDTSRGERQEVELKYVLPDARAFAALLALTGGANARPVRQVNHFFDTPERALRQRKLLLRLRDEDGNFFLTAKGPSSKSADGLLTQKAEAEIPISEVDARAVFAGTRSPLELLESAQSRSESPQLLSALRAALGPAAVLRHIGQFTNERTRVPLALATPAGPVSVILELDRTSFPGERTEYELEVEVPPPVDPDALKEAVEALLGQVPVRPKCARGKSGRFFEILDRG